MLTPFHIAVQVRDLAEARRFYGGLLGCGEGRLTRHLAGMGYDVRAVRAQFPALRAGTAMSNLQECARHILTTSTSSCDAGGLRRLLGRGGEI